MRWCPARLPTGEVILDGNNIYDDEVESGAGAAANRNGLSEADAVSNHVYRRQRRGRADASTESR